MDDHDDVALEYYGTSNIAIFSMPSPASAVEDSWSKVKLRRSLSSRKEINKRPKGGGGPP
ncbi:hypothetical protein M5K25_020357 [Dendrobium thyrsiflorum]|uniref:Uncharacterized protein n=1 Tax=Dendrobium thyrsiflorum TaxID=117978 RepID=A0ABD0U9U4_DENTH